MQGPQHLTVQARPVALKRALTNLVANALSYGGAARVRLAPPTRRACVRSEIEDDGPGIPPAELERVFEPFHRLASRAATGRPAGSGWACRSRATSCARMAATWCWATGRAAGWRRW